MNLFINQITGSIPQILIFSLIPFIWWLVTARKDCNFFKWIGLKKPSDGKENKLIVWIIATIAAFLALSVFMLYSVRDIEKATDDFAGKGASAIPAILIYAFFRTALSEEILFRGFLLKRISNKFGFTIGNITQSALFGILHGIMFSQQIKGILPIVIVLFTGGIGWLLGYINEKKAAGSIVPGWCVHAAANIFSSICTAFSII